MRSSATRYYSDVPERRNGELAKSYFLGELRVASQRVTSSRYAALSPNAPIQVAAVVRVLRRDVRFGVMVAVCVLGTGKSHVAVSPGMRAVENAFGVIFYRLEDLLALMKCDAELSSAHWRRRKYMNISPLIVDEVGFESMSRLDASLFFRLVSYRYRRGNIPITTNNGICDWPELLTSDEVLATAILDRLLHKHHVRNIRGRSYRLRELEERIDALGGAFRFHLQCRHSGMRFFRGSMPGLHVPLSTFRHRPRRRLRMTRGRRGSLTLQRMTLSDSLHLAGLTGAQEAPQ
ncbi:MAG: ATP-binding protein [Candidatus Binatia bacterium]